MQLSDAGQQLATRPVPNPPIAPGFFNNDPSGATAATIVDADFLNALAAELQTILTAAGQTASKTNVNQVWQSLLASLTFSDIGTVNALAISLPGGLSFPSSAVVFGTCFRVRVANTVTGPSTFAPFGIAAAPLVSLVGTPLVNGALQAGAIAEFVNDGLGNWRVLCGGFAPRPSVSGNVTVYVNAGTGNDSNPGTSTQPWQTLAKAVSYLRAIDINGNNVTIQCSGAFTSQLLVSGPFAGSLGADYVNFSFTAGSSIAVSLASAVFGVSGASFTLSGPVTLSATGTSTNQGAGVLAASNSTVALGSGMIFGVCATAHMFVEQSSTIRSQSQSWTISGSAPAHVIVVGASNFSNSVAGITLSGPVTFSTAFVVAADSGIIISPTTTFTNPANATGSRYSVDGTSRIETSGAGASYFPGTVAGSATNLWNYT